MVTQEQIKDLTTRCSALEKYLDIERRKIELEEDEMRALAPGFWDDAKKAEAHMKKVKENKKWIEGHKEVSRAVEELQLAFDFVKDGIASEEELDEDSVSTL